MSRYRVNLANSRYLRRILWGLASRLSDVLFSWEPSRLRTSFQSLVAITLQSKCRISLGFRENSCQVRWLNVIVEHDNLPLLIILAESSTWITLSTFCSINSNRYWTYWFVHITSFLLPYYSHSLVILLIIIWYSPSNTCARIFWIFKLISQDDQCQKLKLKE